MCYSAAFNDRNAALAPKHVLLTSAELRVLADSMDALAVNPTCSMYGIGIGDRFVSVRVRDGQVGVLSYFDGGVLPRTNREA